MESTSFYSWHIANYLSCHEALLWFKPKVYCLNPKGIANYRKTFVDMDKTDPKDAFVIADFARVGKITSAPWKGNQYIALQRLTRCRLHIMENIAREKSYILSNIFLKFSELAALDKSEQPFADKFSASSIGILTEFMSTEEIANANLSKLVAFLVDKGQNRFKDPEATAKILQKAAKDFYRLDKALYYPLNATIEPLSTALKLLKKKYQLLIKPYQKQLKD